MRLVLMGIAIGLAGAFALTRWIASMLFDVSTTDPLTFIVIALLLALVAMLACWIPARRATKVDPVGGAAARVKSTTDMARKTRFRFWHYLIRVIGVIVPRRLRSDWRQEWKAELHHRELLLRRWGSARVEFTKVDLLLRSPGAFGMHSGYSN